MKEPNSLTYGTTAFVLAGGGAKGAFEAGAIRYLVEELSIFPEVITAASAGAIAAVVLAQARSPEEFVQRCEDLRQDLLAMTHTELLFAKQPWVASLDGTLLGQVIDSYLIERARPPIPHDDTTPIPSALSSAPEQNRNLGQWLTASLSALGRLPRTRKGLRGNAGSVLTLNPLADALRNGGPSGIRAVDTELIRRPGLELRLAVVALNAGVLRYVTQDGTIVESDTHTPVPDGSGPVDLIEGVLASASVPMVFPPRPMANDVYVDGGVLQNIPVQAAVRLGAKRIIAVLAVPLDEPPDDRDFTKINLVEVFLRTAGAIAFVDRQITNLAYPLPPDASLTVIDPRIDVVGPFEVALGLMLLDMDYGWLRAADVMADVDEGIREKAVEYTDASVSARTRCWHLEETMWTSGQADSSDLDTLMRLKRMVKKAVTEREKLGMATPPYRENWWTGYEFHGGLKPDVLPDLPLDLD